MKRAKKISIPCLDLTKTFPRSPREKIAGLAHLPRMIDKARALENGSITEYDHLTHVLWWKVVSVGDGLADYQFVGDVMAHKDDDG